VAAAGIRLVVMCMTVSYVLLIQNHGCLNSTNIKSLNPDRANTSGCKVQNQSKNGKLESKKDRRLSSPGVARARAAEISIPKGK